MAQRAVRAAVVAGALLIASLAGGSAAADPVTVRAMPNPGYGRLSFTWPAPVGHTAELRNGVLTLVFDRPIEADVAKLATDIPGYVESARVSADRRTLTVVLTKHYLFRSYANGADVLVDLLGQGVEVAQSAPAASPAASPAAVPPAAPVAQAAPRPQTPPPAAPAAAPRAPTVVDAGARVGAAPVPVRVGDHDGYDRIVFDWTMDVPYTAERGEGRITVDFARADGVDLAPLARGGLANVSKAGANIQNGHTIVTMEVPDGARLRHMRSGTKVVIDVLDAPNTAVAAAPPPAAQPAARAPAAQPTPARTPPAAAQPAAAAQAPAAAQPQTPARAPAQPTPGPQVRPSVNDGLVVSFAQPERGTARITFQWPRVTALAAFQRAGYLWVVFDGAGTTPVPRIPEELGGILQLAERVPAQGGLAFRFKVGEGFYPVLNRTDTTWSVDLAPDPVPPLRPVEILRQNTGDLGAVMIMPLAEASTPAQITDPEVGDVIDVIPVRTLRHGMAEMHSFMQFKLLATAQGLAIQRLDDRVKVQPFTNGVAVTGEQGLFLTPVADGTRLTAPSAPPQAASANANARRTPPLLRFEEWANGPSGAVYESVSQLAYRVSVAPPGARTEPRLALARYYFAQGLYPEALGVLAVAADMDPALLKNRQFLAMRGVAQLRMGRLKDATAELLNGMLDGDAEVAAWRGVLFAEDRNWQAAKLQFALAGDLYQGYPDELAGAISLAKGQAALATTDMATLQQVIAGLETHSLGEGSKLHPRADLLRAQAYAFIDAVPDALRLFNGLVDSGQLPYAAQAALARTQLLVKTKATSIEEAAVELDKWRFAWRGDEFEFRLLTELGNLYLQARDYRNGLATLRQTVSLFPDMSKTEGIAQKMNTVFADLFLRGESEKIAPVPALALYYDFRELTPVGTEGDEMVRRLADRLVSVDLLRQAADLLEYQVQFRLRGEEKALVAAHLAGIYLLARQPQKALEAIQNSRWRIAAASLNTERNQLEARALGELRRYDEALALLATDSTRDAMLLRGDIQWRAQNWAAAARSLDQYLGERWRGEEALTPSDRRQVLRVGVSLVMAEDKTGLARLRDRYRAKMTGTAEGDAFEIITDQVNPANLAFREVAQRVAQLDILESFRDKYLRAGRRPGQVAAIN